MTGSAAQLATESVTVKSRAAELLIHSRRYRALIDQIEAIMQMAEILPSPEQPTDKSEEPNIGALTPVLTDTVVINNENLRRLENLVDELAIALTGASLQ